MPTIASFLGSYFLTNIPELNCNLCCSHNSSYNNTDLYRLYLERRWTVSGFDRFYMAACSTNIQPGQYSSSS